MGRDGLRIPRDRGPPRCRGCVDLGARAGPGLQLGPDPGGVMATSDVIREGLLTVDLAVDSVRELNRRLHVAEPAARVRVLHPGGKHSIAVGLDALMDVDIEGHVGYYCAGMNKHAHVRVHGNCGVGVAENIMSGTVVVEGSASQSAVATGRGGL